MDRGWRPIGPDPAIAAWAKAARPLAEAAISNADADWRCGGTWCVGLDALDNDEAGNVAGLAFPWSSFGLVQQPLHRAQISTVRPGYPLPSDGENEAGFRFRLNRDAAHLDGVIAEGPEKRRFIREPHAWILGIALNETSRDASPLTVWEGSHEIIRTALLDALAKVDRADWGNSDLTEAYQHARKKVFETCKRVCVPIRPGEATLLHRLTIHGVAPWAEAAAAPKEGRMIAYFRPLMPSVEDWLLKP